jgi:diaminohydroxyphosphoribosylaminopyrimidine deaminase / 5-amino-6-(5-phosphoribosylamino)uracil reductase
VIQDDPSLTTRLQNRLGRHPIRILVDSQGTIPMMAKAFIDSHHQKVILATTQKMDGQKEEDLLAMGVEIIKTESKDGQVDLMALMQALYERSVDGVLLEGGGTLNASMLSLGLVDKVMMFIAPKIIGGKNAKTPVEGEGILRMADAILLKKMRTKMFGEDLLIEGYL